MRAISTYGYPDGWVFKYFIAALNDCGGLTLESARCKGHACYCDWRLPQIDELLGIVDCCFGSPCIDQSAFGPTNPDSFYWSASSLTNSSPPLFFAWRAYLGDGNADLVPKAYSHNVRAVRGGL